MEVTFHDQAERIIPAAPLTSAGRHVLRRNSLRQTGGAAELPSRSRLSQTNYPAKSCADGYRRDERRRRRTSMHAFISPLWRRPRALEDGRRELNTLHISSEEWGCYARVNAELQRTGLAQAAWHLIAKFDKCFSIYLFFFSWEIPSALQHGFVKPSSATASFHKSLNGSAVSLSAMISSTLPDLLNPRRLCRG